MQPDETSSLKAVGKLLQRTNHSRQIEGSANFEPSKLHTTLEKHVNNIRHIILEYVMGLRESSFGNRSLPHSELCWFWVCCWHSWSHSWLGWFRHHLHAKQHLIQLSRSNPVRGRKKHSKRVPNQWDRSCRWRPSRSLIYFQMRTKKLASSSHPSLGFC